MSILSWLKAVSANGSSAEAIQSQTMQFADGEEQFHGLNMKNALDAHIEWSHRLEAQISKTATEELEVGIVASDDRCTLGKWLHSVARDEFGNLPEYEELKRIHAAFHLKAGEILNDVQNGETENARALLKDLRRGSGEVQLSLVRLYSKAAH